MKGSTVLNYTQTLLQDSDFYKTLKKCSDFYKTLKKCPDFYKTLKISEGKKGLKNFPVFLKKRSSLFSQIEIRPQKFFWVKNSLDGKKLGFQ